MPAAISDVRTSAFGERIEIAEGLGAAGVGADGAGAAVGSSVFFLTCSAFLALS